jgi:hypothetical protein
MSPINNLSSFNNVKDLCERVVFNSSIKWFKSEKGVIIANWTCGNKAYITTLEELNKKAQQVIKADEDAASNFLAKSTGHKTNMVRNFYLGKTNSSTFEKSTKKNLDDANKQKGQLRIYKSSLIEKLKKIPLEVSQLPKSTESSSSASSHNLPPLPEIEEGEVDPLQEEIISICDDITEKDEKKKTKAKKRPREETVAKTVSKEQKVTTDKSIEKTDVIPPNWRTYFVGLGLSKKIWSLLEDKFSSLKENPEEFKKFALYGASTVNPDATLFFIVDIFEKLDWPSEALKSEVLPQMLSTVMHKMGVISVYRDTDCPYGKITLNLPLAFKKEIYKQEISRTLARGISHAINEFTSTIFQDMKPFMKNGEISEGQGIEIYINLGDYCDSILEPLLPYFRGIPYLTGLYLGQKGINFIPTEPITDFDRPKGFKDEHIKKLRKILTSNTFLRNIRFNIDGMSSEGTHKFLLFLIDYNEDRKRIRGKA